ncbi:hypothetical protein [Nocardia arthritidis]|uniref:DUF333 domain-containing protein n=1 Tax=Nocardia arthritidis TaxID=228602 RepID=A0A6G9YCH8_9NOCA|nr:hypothetical protein [Nocardia arthritidis]QIS10939.1 hypothetical protein F5544_15280 [Nocardia arthritidis]
MTVIRIATAGLAIAAAGLLLPVVAANADTGDRNVCNTIADRGNRLYDTRGNVVASCQLAPDGHVFWGQV